MHERKTVSEAVDMLFAEHPLRKVLVAYSGGPDSGALLHAVSAFRDRTSGIEVCACWVNHALRPQAEMEREQRHAEAFAASLAVPLVIVTAQPGEIRALASGKEGGLEAAARQFRYGKLHAVCGERGCERILTAHTLDDVVETLVMRFFSGSGAEGLAGIPSEQGLVLRPLLCTTKALVLEYMNAHKITYSVDSTNAETLFLRNKIRHELIPVVERVFPQYIQALGTLRAKAELDKKALTFYAEALFENSDRAGIRLDAFLTSPEAVQIRALYLLVRRQRGRLPWNTVRGAAARLRNGQNAALGDLELRIGDGLIRMHGKAEEPVDLFFSVFVTEPCTVDLGSGITLSINAETGHEGPHCGLRADACAFPFVVRSLKHGDSILTSSGHKRVESIRQEWKLSPEEKHLVFVVEDRDGIAAVWGSHIGKSLVFRHNPNLAKSYSNGYITIEMKGVHTQ